MIRVVCVFRAPYVFSISSMPTSLAEQALHNNYLRQFADNKNICVYLRSSVDNYFLLIPTSTFVKYVV
jgi:hypothetical protein